MGVSSLTVHFFSQLDGGLALPLHAMARRTPPIKKWKSEGGIIWEMAAGVGIRWVPFLYSHGGKYKL